MWLGTEEDSPTNKTIVLFFSICPPSLSLSLVRTRARIRARVYTRARERARVRTYARLYLI